jgi:hypothetical protein
MLTHYTYHWGWIFNNSERRSLFRENKNYITGNLDNQTPKKLCTCVHIPSSQNFGILEFRLLNPFCCNL